MLESPKSRRCICVPYRACGAFLLTSGDMPDEIWGTFSIDDHRRPRAFVADVLLYDQLVIPVPADRENERLWAQWGVDVAQLHRRLEILAAGGLAQPVAWSEGDEAALHGRLDAAKGVDEEGRQKLAETLYRGAVASTGPWLAGRINFLAGLPPQRLLPASESVLRHMEATGNVPDWLAAQCPWLRGAVREWVPLRARSPGSFVEAVAAYPSFRDFAVDIDLEPPEYEQRGHAVARTHAPEGRQMAGVFGWELFVPEEGRLTDDELLVHAVKFALQDDIREKRHDFHEWRRKQLSRGVMNEDALADFERRAAAYRHASSRIKTKTRVVNAFTVLSIGGSLASAILAFPPAGIGAALFTAARFAADQKLAGDPPDAEARAVAMFHDARRHFGWRGAPDA
jgi:hypothetical protein